MKILNKTYANQKTRKQIQKNNGKYDKTMLKKKPALNPLFTQRFKLYIEGV
jgi:hypothetical protein